MNRDEMINAMREIAVKLSLSTVPRHQYIQETGLSERQIYNTFGSYNALVEAAGLKPTKFPTSGAPLYSDKESLAEIARVLRLPESKLSRNFFEQNASISSSVYERRFGGWRNALKRVTELLDPVKESNLIARIIEYTAPSLLPCTAQDLNNREFSQTDTSNDDASPKEIQPITNFPTDSANLYGDFINFRGLQHAPVNEQGVVFLFGMICRELGYVVEIVRQGFPDCEAKRQIPGPKVKWQRVRIEFEFESRTFKSHGHDILTNAMLLFVGNITGQVVLLKYWSCDHALNIYHQIHDRLDKNPLIVTQPLNIYSVSV
jgi:hypothetical protein